MEFCLQFDESKIEYWSKRYYYEKEQHIETEVAPRFRKHGYLLRQDFLDLCEWKSPRPRKHYADNTDDFIREVTRTALSTNCEKLRIEALTLLNGVSWPVASAILHFGFDNLYPIWDFRALWSVGITDPVYDFDRWMCYTKFCRDLALRCCVTMRALDRALWQYSKENQKR